MVVRCPIYTASGSKGIQMKFQMIVGLVNEALESSLYALVATNPGTLLMIIACCMKRLEETKNAMSTDATQ